MRLSFRQFARQSLMASIPRRFIFDRMPASARSLYLTFDDGPHPEWTPRLLDQLHKYRLKATFFVVGREAERCPEIVQQIVAQGHAIGSHSWRHSAANETNADTLAAETTQTCNLIEDITGVRTRLCRPPFGGVSVAKLWRLWKLRQTVVLWNVDPRDYQCERSSELIRRLRYTPLTAGDVILMHDNRQVASDAMTYLTECCAAAELKSCTLASSFPDRHYDTKRN